MVTINCILQDRKGFMWFGTQDGLNRYDGYDFKIYKHDPDNDKTISDSYIWCILEDQYDDNILWIGTINGGLNKFDQLTERFKQYRHDENIPQSLSHNDVKCIHQDSTGVLWIGTDGGGLNKFDKKKGEFKHYKTQNENGLSNNRVTSICEDKEGMLWIGTDGGGLNKFDKNTEEFTPFRTDNSNLSKNRVMVVYVDKSGTLWVGTEGGGLNKFDRKSGEFIHYTAKSGKLRLSHDEITAIFEDSKGILWIGTRGGGLNKFDRTNDRIISYKRGTSSYSLSQDDVRSIYEDRYGVLWVGTRGEGLNLFDPNSGRFKLYTHDGLTKNSLSHKTVLSIYEDSSKILWIGTYGGGLNKFDRETGNFKHYKHDPQKQNSLSHDFVRAIVEDQYKRIWIGTEGGGLNMLIDPAKKQFKHYKHDNDDPDSLSHNEVWVIHKGQLGALWIGTTGGLSKFDQVGNKKNKSPFINYKNDDQDSKSLSHNIVRAIYEDRDGDLWIGTRGGGLNKLIDPVQKHFERHMNDTSDHSSLSHNYVLCIYEDKSGTLWVGTYGGGLNKMTDRKNGIFRSYREKDGLPNDTIYSILEDKEGNLWLSTNKGISKFTPKTESSINFDAEDGLQSNEFNAGAYFKNEDGEMFFGGVDGFNSFFPEIIRHHVDKPPIVIDKFLLLNELVKIDPENKNSLLKKAIHETKSITLSHSRNIFSFEFAALHYASPGKNKYKYKLEGYNNDWIETDAKNRRATYTNLPAGDYIFKVTGKIKNGNWNEEGTSSIKIKILPPPWKTWWAYTLYILASIAIVYLIGFVWFQRKKMSYERSLVHADKMSSLGILVAGVAHEINNPTSYVHTSTYNLKQDLEKLKDFLRELAGDDADDEILAAFDERFNTLFNHLNNLQDGTTRIKDIVRDLRAFSRVDRTEMKAINLHEGLKVTLNLVSFKYKDKVDFVLDSKSDLEIKGNSAEINQVFMNIMVNACQAIVQKQKSNRNNSKGTLTIQTRKENNHAAISFQDSGIGMPEKVRQKIFDPFFTTKPVGEGVGLGLSISFSIIKEHYGRIKVVSKEGEGTTVTLYLPIKSNKK